MLSRSALILGSMTLAILSIASYGFSDSGDCPPPPGTATGCHCAQAACPDGDADICLSGICLDNSDCWYSGTTGIWVYNPEDSLTCVVEAPLEGNGCDNGVSQSRCTIKYFCDCDWNFFCGNEDQGTGAGYIPCFP